MSTASSLSFSLSQHDAVLILAHLSIPMDVSSHAVSELASRLRAFADTAEMTNQGNGHGPASGDSTRRETDASEHFKLTSPPLSPSLSVVPTQDTPISVPSVSLSVAPTQDTLISVPSVSPARLLGDGSPAERRHASLRRHTPYPRVLSARSAGHSPSFSEGGGQEGGGGYPSEGDESGGDVRAGRLRGGRPKPPCKRGGVAPPPPDRVLRERGARTHMGPDIPGMEGVSDDGGCSDTSSGEGEDSRRSVLTDIVDDPMDVDPAPLGGDGHYIVNEGLPLAEPVKLCSYAQELLRGISMVALDCIHGIGYSKMATNMHHLMCVLIFGGLEREWLQGAQTATKSPGCDQSLLGLAFGLHQSENLEAALQLNHVCQAMEFTAHVQARLRDSKEPKFPTRFDLFSHIASQAQASRLGVSRSQLNRYYCLGSKVSLLAGAGSIYMVFFIIVARARSLLASLTGDMVAELARVIRWPDDSPTGRTVKEVLIPAILNLRLEYPLGFDLLFASPGYLQLVGATGFSDAMNLRKSDEIFSFYKYNLIEKPRCEKAWQCLLCLPDPEDLWNKDTVRKCGALCQAADPSSPSPIPQALSAVTKCPKIQWDKIGNSLNVLVIDTKFSLEKAGHISLNGLKPEERLALTQQHRKWAAKGVMPSTFKSLKKRIEHQLEGGKPSRKDVYTVIDTAHFSDHIIKIRDSKKGMVAMLISTMPQKLREDTYAAVLEVHSDILKDLDTSQQKEAFRSIHYSVWNRYTKKGNGAPSDVHPSSIRREGRENVLTTRVNIPRESEESKLWQSHKERLRTACAPFFAWVEKTLKELLPDAFSVLELAVNVLPVGDTVLAHPFTSVVVNFNVNTVMHVDNSDKEICMVFQLSDCKGGELGLAEPGLLFRLRNGDGVIFKSNEITHFNLDFVGKRMSMVFHSDSKMDSWTNGFNGWGNNRYFSGTQ